MKNLFKNKLYLIASFLVVLILILVIVFSFIKTNNPSNIQNTKNESNATADLPQADEEEDSGEPSHAETLDAASETEDEGQQIFFIEKSDVQKFSLTDANGILLEFQRDGDQWICTDEESLDLNEERVDKILNYICDVRFVESYISEDGSEYGLTADSDIFVVEDSGGNDVYVCLGDVDESDGGIYFALNYDYTQVFKNSGKLSNVCKYYIEELIE